MMNTRFLNKGTTILAGTILATIMMIMTAPAVSAATPDSFKIQSFGIVDKSPSLTVEGTAGADTPPSGEIYAYVFVTNDGIYAVTSHPDIEDSNEVKDDAQWHAHKIQLNDKNCITDLSEKGKAELDGNTVSVEKTKATELSAVKTAHLKVENGEVCVVDVFDSKP